MNNNSESRMNVVIVGHVDHGKSTVIGRLLYDTGSLPDGKIEQVRKNCERSAKPFEFAFLIDALKDEQSQGITIDSARCFFKTDKRSYVIIDAPGHREFIKNMVTGASRADGALLVIDAHEGVQENTKRHAFLLSFLGIRQVSILINKMDMVDFSENAFTRIRDEYKKFLSQIGISPQYFIPVCARNGDNFTSKSPNTPWYDGPVIIDVIDSFEKNDKRENKPFRFPVHDIYKFTESADDRRIIAGTVETGSIRTGDEVAFLPSGKKSVINSVEVFNEPLKNGVSAGYTAGFTLKDEFYLKPGEVMFKTNERPPESGSVFKANLFWLGIAPMVMGKKYKMKINANRTYIFLEDIINIIDATDLGTEKNKKNIERFDVAECVFKTLKPVSFDFASQIEYTGRFVVIDNYEIAGGGIITENLREQKSYIQERVEKREYAWRKSPIDSLMRSARYHQTPKFIVVSGNSHNFQEKLGHLLEKDLFEDGRNVYYLGLNAFLSGIDSESGERENHDEHILHIGELGRILTDTGMIFIASLPELDNYDMEILKVLNEPNEIFFVNIGDIETRADITIAQGRNVIDAVAEIKSTLYKKNVLLEYYL